MNINKLGNGIGLLYVTDIAGTGYLLGDIANDGPGADLIKNHALSRSSEGFPIEATGSFDFTTLTNADNIFSFTIDGVSAITNSVAVLAGQEDAGAILLAAEINSTIPVSGAKYKATAIGSKVLLSAPSGYGAYVNGHVVAVNPAGAGNTFTIENIDGGTDGDELVSTVNGYRYWLNPTSAAVAFDIASPGTEEISSEVIMRGVQSQHTIQKQTIASKSITDLPRYDRFSVLELGAGANTELDVIQGKFAKNDILVLQNTSPFTVTINDLSVSSGNIKIDPTTFSMVNDDYVIWLMYMDDSTDGLVWREIYRKPTTLSTDSITDVELANLSVGTAELKDTSVSTAKIVLGAITNALMASNSVNTSNILDDAITTSKIVDLAISTAKLIDSSVTEIKIADGAVATAKIADGAVTLSKVSVGVKADSMVVPVSWETGEMGIIKVRMPASEVIDIFVSISKQIEGSDDATLVPKDNSGTIMTGGTVDLPGGAPVGNDNSSQPTGNNIFANGEEMGLETLKTTAGGKAVVTISYNKL